MSDIKVSVVSDGAVCFMYKCDKVFKKGPSKICEG